MKISKIIFLLAVAAIGLISCHKDEEKRSMDGTWEGLWGFGSDTPSFYEKWKLEEDGELNAYFPSGGVYASGTWEMHGEEFECHYTPIWANYTYHFTGHYDEDDDTITGDWGESSDPTNGGTFKMDRN